MDQDKNLDTLEQIERYLEGTMPDNERTAFERMMNNDARLAEDVKAYRGINFAIANKDYLELKNHLLKAKKVIEDIRENVQVDYQAETEKSKEPVLSRDYDDDAVVRLFKELKQFLFPARPAFRLAYVMAVLAILLIPSYIIFFAGPDTEQLFADSFTPYPNTITSTRSESKEDLNDLDKAMLTYEKKDYAKSLDLFNNYLSENPAQYEAIFYRGITNLELGNTKQALSDFESVIKNKSTLENQAKWYMALLHLKDGQEKDAVKILKELREQPGGYREKAEVILEKLN